MPAPLPLALGLIFADLWMPRAEVARFRVQMGAFAFREGYALVDTFAVAGSPVRDDAALAGLAALADRCTVRTLLVADDVPPSYVATVRRRSDVAVVLLPSRLLAGR